MKYLIAELLDKLAEKESESKELVAQVEALEIVVTALLRKLGDEQRQELSQGIGQALATAADGASAEDASLLHSYIDKLLNYPRY
ncbi:anti-adapter protein IraP [Mixta intestinalis]|jgi:ribosomal protein L12E/L44/L45/RPP1/RPP2|uniref:Anti-adapter protein IraP n=1 Tax=Mixta intestinalis TaxID=1615494 RepID=A0A6P1PUF1_9GAMM|nr:anti-adapter protein IraP [Mixta intestinalis]QHM70090.1 Anti-adapter protein IraP [Mixta intestinalis]